MFRKIMKAMALSAIWGLFYIVIWSDAVQLSKLKVEVLTCAISYGHVIATTQAYSAISCGAICESWTGCRSSMLDVKTETCYLNNNTKTTSDMVQGECGKDLKYIEKPAVITPCTSTYGCQELELPACESETDKCQQCKKDRCVCLFPYFYSLIEDKCYPNCTKYQDSFQFYKDSYSYFGDANMRTNVNLTGCLEVCLSETNFTCNWFTYSANASVCTFTNDYFSGSYDSDVSSAFYRRICSEP